MNIVDWFDPDNIEHLKAYKHLQHTGSWPEGFIPEMIEFGPLWSVRLASRIVDVYIEEKLNNFSYYEDYTYYVGGEITCGRMPMKYSAWITAGRPA